MPEKLSVKNLKVFKINFFMQNYAFNRRLDLRGVKS